MADPQKTGQGIRVACETRRFELQQALAHLAPGEASPTRTDLEAALVEVDELLVGDLDHLPAMITERLSGWLTRSKYLGLKEQREIDAARAASRPPG
ncbi:MAG: hypothetical protein H6709_01380 [Kofleriaceae bacterium]|nr:hypothetical protein [Myxococcales bacterium]MCB9562518.1 hypothetical protein [Kofleriaceae bacterium]MCB9570721.1 hypothetical protein [Kofleriaceae bacterium]